MACLVRVLFPSIYFFKILNEHKSSIFPYIEIHRIYSDNSNFRIKHIDKNKAIYSEEIK